MEKHPVDAVQARGATLDLLVNEIPGSSGIYAIINKITGERYVGQAVNMRERIRDHVRALNNGQHFANIKRRWLQEAWNQYGAHNFEFRVLELVANNKHEQPYVERADNLSLAEQFYITEKSEYNPDKSICHARYQHLIDSFAWRRPKAQSTLTRCENERAFLQRLVGRLKELNDFFCSESLPTEQTTIEDWHRFLYAMKKIVGNASNDVSFIAALMAKDYLCSRFDMRPFDVALKPQGAPGLDIDERTVDGRRVIAEIKTTTPYNGPDLGARQKATFTKDFIKLNTAQADEKFFFVTDRTTFELMRRKYMANIPGVSVVLLPDREIHAPAFEDTRKL